MNLAPLAEILHGGGTALSPALPAFALLALFALLCTRERSLGVIGRAGLIIVAGALTVAILGAPLTHGVLGVTQSEPFNAAPTSVGLLAALVTAMLAALGLTDRRAQSTPDWTRDRAGAARTMRSGLSAVHTWGVMAMVLALGVTGAYTAQAAARTAPNHALAATAKHKHPKKHARKHTPKRHHHKSGHGSPNSGHGSPSSGPGSAGGSRSMTIDSALDTATGTPDYVTGASDHVDVKMTVATPTPLADAVLIYLTKGGCFQSLSDANQYTTNQFIANDSASVGDRSVVNWLNQGVPAGSASGTFDAVSAVASGYSTVCATIYNHQVDPITFIVTNTPYFTISAPLTSG
jgi:hypothetical protein